MKLMDSRELTNMNKYEDDSLYRPDGSIINCEFCGNSPGNNNNCPWCGDLGIPWESENEA